MTRAEQPAAEALRGAMARGDLLAVRSRSVLSQLVVLKDHSLLAEDTIARVSGMLGSLSAELLRRQAEAAGKKTQGEFVALHSDLLVERLAGNGELLAHLQALALEWKLVGELEISLAMDPVVSPLLQGLVGHEDADIASAAMASIAAQARFAQSQRRMSLPLAELPADLFHSILLDWRSFVGEPGSDAVLQAEKRLRAEYDEAATRLSLLSRLTTLFVGASQSSLQIEQAGVALFLSVLSARSGQSREQAALSTNRQLVARLILGLRAAGLRPAEVEEQTLRIFPEVRLPPDLDSIGTREAAEWLSDTPRGGL